MEFIPSEQLHVVSRLKQDTFLCDVGGSHTNLTIVSTSLVAKVENQTAGFEIELFTGAPYRGHMPVWTKFSTHSPEEGLRLVRDWKLTDWNYFRNELEQQNHKDYQLFTVWGMPMISGAQLCQLLIKQQK